MFLRLILLSFIFCLVSSQSAAAFSTAGWLPYWKKETGIPETIKNIDAFSEISPFAYSVTSSGTLKNDMKIEGDDWQQLFTLTKKKGVKVYPSILWTNRDQMEITLNDKKKRAAHIKAIVAEVNAQKFDGIDIDYEGKSAETREGFSRFLEELGKELKKTKKSLVCTIEARTPIDSRYATITQELLKEIEYSNDYKAIGKACDQVRIMAYDQLGGDVALARSNSNQLYRPVSDITWVKKVLTLALRDIPKSKLVVGVATYGYKYEVATKGDGSLSYKRIGVMNYQYAEELRKALGVEAVRNSAGELSYSYASSTDAGNKDGVVRQYLVWYSDGEAIADKIRIAKLYGMRGVAVFRIDGAQDQKLFTVLRQAKAK